MDQAARWRTSSSGQKGPFTVDSGGGDGGIAGGNGTNPQPRAIRTTMNTSNNNAHSGSGSVGGGGISASPSASSLSSLRGAAMNLVGGLMGNTNSSGRGMNNQGTASGSGTNSNATRDPRTNPSRQSSLNSNSSRADGTSRIQGMATAAPSIVPYQRPLAPVSRSGNNGNPVPTTQNYAQPSSRARNTPRQSPSSSNAPSPQFVVPGPSRAQTPSSQAEMDNLQYSSSPQQGLFGSNFHQAMVGEMNQHSTTPSMNIQQGQRRPRTSTNHPHPYSRSGSSTPVDPPPSPFGQDGYNFGVSQGSQYSHSFSSATPTNPRWNNTLGDLPSSAIPPVIGEPELDWNSLQQNFSAGQGGQQPYMQSASDHYQAALQNLASQQFLASLQAEVAADSAPALSNLTAEQLSQLLTDLANKDTGPGGDQVDNSGSEMSPQHYQEMLHAADIMARAQAASTQAMSAQIPINSANQSGPSLLSRRMQQFQTGQLPGEQGQPTGSTTASVSSMSTNSKVVLPTPPASFSSSFAYPPGRLNTRPTAAGWGPGRGLAGGSGLSDYGSQRQQSRPNTPGFSQTPEPLIEQAAREVSGCC